MPKAYEDELAYEGKKWKKGAYRGKKWVKRGQKDQKEGLDPQK